MHKAKKFNLRSFLNDLEAMEPNAIARVSEKIDVDYDATSIVMELEKHNKDSVLLFENVDGYKFPVIANTFGARRRFAQILGVSTSEILEEWSKCGDVLIAPDIKDDGPVHDVVIDSEIDLSYLPIMKHFEDDAGRYISNALVVAKDPESEIYNASFHRMQIKGKTRVGTSIHSRRHLWNYAKRAEQRGEDLPIAIIIGCHPLVTMGGLWKGDIDVDEYSVIGGLMKQPLEVINGCTIPLLVPAEAEIVLEGRILANVREPEGPFGEFTGYSSERSTQHVVEISAITHRKDAIYQDIIPGISEEHTGLLAAPQEARLLKALKQQYPNVTAVRYPKSGTCRLHAYIALKDPAPGQARNAAAAALGDDLSLKLVIVVDSDVDIFSDEDVLWALATRMQADEDIDILRNCMGAILDPSNHDGLTSKMVIDATKPKGFIARRHTLAEVSTERVRGIIERLL